MLFIILINHNVFLNFRSFAYYFCENIIIDHLISEKHLAVIMKTLFPKLALTAWLLLAFNAVHAMQFCETELTNNTRTIRLSTMMNGAKYRYVITSDDAMSGLYVGTWCYINGNTTCQMATDPAVERTLSADGKTLTLDVTSSTPPKLYESLQVLFTSAPDLAQYQELKNVDVDFTCSASANDVFYYLNYAHSWANPVAYMWDPNSGKNVAMTNSGVVDGNGVAQIWQADVESGYGKVLFHASNDNWDNQSADAVVKTGWIYDQTESKWFSGKVYFVSDETGWSKQGDWAFSDWDMTSTTVTMSKQLTASTTYHFKLVREAVQGSDATTAADEWRSHYQGAFTDSGTINFNSKDGSDDNCTLTTSAIDGVYTFTYDFVTHDLTVTYPLPTSPTSVPVTATFANSCQQLPLFGTALESRTLSSHGWSGMLSTQVLADANSVNHNVAHLTEANYVAIASPNNETNYDATNFTKLHVDFWSAGAKSFNLKLLCRNSGGGYSDGNTVSVTTPAGTWYGVDIPLTSFNQGDNLARVCAVYPVDLNNGELWVANAYLYNESADCATALTEAIWEGVSAENLVTDPGTAFTNGYTYSMRTTGHKVVVTLNLLDDRTIGNAYWYLHNGDAQGAENVASVSNGGKTVTFEITSDFSGAALADDMSVTFSAKFAYNDAGSGMSRTSKITFSVGQNNEFVPTSVPANRTDLADCQVKAIFGTTGYTPLGINIIEWDAATSSTETIAGKQVKKITVAAAHKTMLKFNQLNLPDLGMTHVHFDVWSPVSRDFASSLYCGSTRGENISKVTTGLVAGQWKSIDYPLSDLTVQNADLELNSTQALIVNMGIGTTAQTTTFYIANVYFYTETQNCGWEPTTIPADPTDIASCRVTGIYGLNGYSCTGYIEYGFAANTDQMLQIGDKYARKITNYSNGGIVFNNGTGVGNNDYLHIDLWHYRARTVNLRLDCGGWTEGSATYAVNLAANSWTSVDIPLTSLPNVDQATADNKALRIMADADAEPIYFTNFYLYNHSTTVPVMTSTPTLATMSGNSAVINVSATYDSNEHNDFVVTNTTTGLVSNLTATAGKITVPSIAPCVANNLEIKAVYNDCYESASQSINVAGADIAVDENLVTPSLTVTADLAALPAKDATDGVAGTRWGSGNSAKTDRHYIDVDLGSVYSLNTIKIGWETACPNNYFIKTSQDGVNYYPVYHATSAPAHANNVAADYDTYNLPTNVAGRYLRIESKNNNTDYGMSIWEIEAYGACATAPVSPVMYYATADEVYDDVAVVSVGAGAESTPFAGIYYHVLLTNNNSGEQFEFTQQTADISFAGYGDNNSECTFRLINLNRNTSYTARVWAVVGSEDIAANRSANYVDVSFNTMAKSGLHFLSEQSGWEGAIHNVDWQFDYTSTDGVFYYSRTLDRAPYQYRLYDATYGVWAEDGNRFFFDHNGDQMIMTAKGTGQFVSNFDEMYIAGTVLDGNSWDIRESGKMTNSGTTFTWEGFVHSGGEYKLVIKNKWSANPSEYDWRWDRVMTSNATFTGDYDYGRLTFDMLTWTCTWEEIDDEAVYCIEEGGAGYRTEDVGGVNQAFNSGYRISVITDNDVDNGGADKSVTFRCRVLDSQVMTNCIFQIYPNLNPAENVLECTTAGALTRLGDNLYQITITPNTKATNQPTQNLIGDWTKGAPIRYSFKFEYETYLLHTGPDYYYMQEGCAPDTFVIYHAGQKNATLHPDAVERFDGGKILQPIQYRRLLTPDQWHTLVLPFDVNAVRVFDPDDAMWYDLYPRYSNDGTMETATDNAYYLRAFRGAVGQDDFERNWYDAFPGSLYAGGVASQLLPKKDVPYIIRVPAGNYYLDKPIVFFGAGYQTIATDQVLGERPVSDDSFVYYANSTMKPFPTGQTGYMLTNHGQEFRRVDSMTIPAFECYVLANAETIRRVGIIRRRDHQGPTTSLLDNVADNEMLDNAMLYDITGKVVKMYKNIVVKDLVEDCSGLAQGVYVVSATNHEGQKVNVKLLLGGRAR